MHTVCTCTTSFAPHRSTLNYFYVNDMILIPLSKQWTGEYWKHSGLHKLGLTMQLGHNGGPCPHPQPFERPLVVVHVNGIHMVNVSYCDCHTQPGGYYLGTQLIRSCWFPATMVLTRTAFTFEVLENFHYLTLQGKATAWDFYQALVHRTDNTGLFEPRVSEFLTAVQAKRG